MDDAYDQTEWQRWVEEHAGKFLLFARQKARCEADAQDLVQEAILEATDRLGSNQPPAPALVFATIHRRAIDWARREDRRTGREVASSDSAPQAWFDTSAEDRELARWVQGAMNQLPQMYREVISLKLWGGLTFAEIATALEIPANTAASRYRYGLVELRKLSKEVLT